MNDLPPAGSTRRRATLAFWTLFTVVFVVLFAHRATLWLARGEEFPLLAAIGGTLGFIAVWRWIAARAEGSPS